MREQNSLKKFKKMPLFISIILLIFSCFVFLFLYKQTQNNNQSAMQSETKWQSETTRRNGIKSLDRLLKMVLGERALLDTHFAKSSDIVPFLDMIEKLAPLVGTKAEVVLVDVPKDSPSLVVGVNATGRFENLYKFLTLLENSPYELDFISMDLRKSNEGNISPDKIPDLQWAANFKIQLLSFIP